MLSRIIRDLYPRMLNFGELPFVFSGPDLDRVAIISPAT